MTDFLTPTVSIKTEVAPLDFAALATAANLLSAGQLVAMPTETVYGLAGHAFDPIALAAIFAAKERPTFDPLIVHIAPAQPVTLAALEAMNLVDPSTLSLRARVIAEQLMRKFWPGPLTLVLPRHAAVPDLVTAGLPTVAIRFPSHTGAQSLIRAAGFPLAAPSANRFGRISPTSSEAVYAELRGRIPLVLDGGRCTVGLESTVVAVEEDGNLSLLRPGSIDASALVQVTGASILYPDVHPAEVRAPGMLERHYAPGTPLYLLPQDLALLPREALHASLRGRKVGLLLRQSQPQGPWTAVETLSPKGDLAEMARHFFAALRRLDASEADLILAEPIPGETGLAHALRNRMAKAAEGAWEMPHPVWVPQLYNPQKHDLGIGNL